MDSTLVLTAGAGSVAVVSALGLWFWRRRRVSAIEPYGFRLRDALEAAELTEGQLRRVVGGGVVRALASGVAERLTVQQLVRAADCLGVHWLEIIRRFSVVPVPPTGDDYRQECQRLQAKINSQADDLQRRFRTQVVQRLAGLFCQYPTLRKAVERKPELPAKSLIKMLDCMDKLQVDLRIQPIGEVGGQVAFDPDLHESYNGDDLVAGEPVYVRYIGIMGDGILYRAKVSRELPA